MSMDQTVQRVSELLHEVAETHHLVWKITDGSDPDWASWYADHLVRLTRFPEYIGKPVVRSELVYMLVKLDKEYAAEQPREKWEDYYARKLLQHFR
jgi:hypothetical protein